MMKDQLAVTVVQADLAWEDVDANLASFEEKLSAHSESSDIIVLPEMFSTGFSMDPQKVAEPPKTRTYKWMRMIADQKQALVLGSFVVKEKAGYYNRLHAVKPGGEFQVYDKRHLFIRGEDDKYEAGKDRLIIEWKGWKIHPLICYDLRFPVWSRSQMRQGQEWEYDLLVYVANWPAPRVFAWSTLLKARAIENQSYCVGVNRVGEDPNFHGFPGQSAVLDYLGEELHNCDDREEIITIEIDMPSMQKFREKMPFQLDSDRFSIQD